MVTYTPEKVTDRITAIRTISGEIMYLIEGTERAFLIDTGTGLVGLREIVESLIAPGKPVTVLISHGHVDHAMGAVEFDDCYMNPADRPTYVEHSALENRKGYMAMALQDRIDQLTDDDYLPSVPDYPFHDLLDGSVWDAGGVTIIAHHTPGHTPGSTCFLIPEERILITGDTCNSFTFLFEHFCLPVDQYQQQMVTLRDKTAGAYDRVFLMHHLMDAPVDLLDQMIALCDRVLAGETDNVPFEFMGNHAVIAVQTDENLQQADGGFAKLSV